MTKKRFWDNPYLTQLDTKVTGVAGSDVTIEETILYPVSGGQECDTGMIGGSRVIAAREDGNEIVYALDRGHGLRPGDPVTIHIDWNRRYRLMRLHFAAEIVLELVYRSLKPIEKIGAHISEDKARIDFQWNDNISNVLPAIKSAAHEIIHADRPIVSAFNDEQHQRRYWEIEGFARVPCGGTHLRRTGEVGEIELKRKNIGRGKERIEIYLS